ncbi:MAG: hypothetical protein IJF38_07360 [Clostridia bacterium]|nr:hypothetical protein [Clostridia bacterium]
MKSIRLKLSALAAIFTLVILVGCAFAVFTVGAVAQGEADSTYGSIPSAYSSKDDYPFALFTRGATDSSYTFVSAHNNLSKTSADTANGFTIGAFQAAKNAAVGKTGTVAVILMRRDFTNAGAYANTTQLYGGEIVFDLGGHTLTTSVAIVDAVAKGTNSGESRYTFKDGFITATGTGLLSLRSLDTLSAEKTFSFTFENICFNLTSGFNGSAYLAYAGSLGSTHRINYDITLNSCSIDLLNNLPTDITSVNIVDFKNSSSLLKGRLTVCGVNLMATGVGGYGFALDTDDSVVYKKSADGIYFDVEIPDADYPFGNQTFKSVDGKTLQFGSRQSRSITFYSLGEAIKTPYGDIPHRYSYAERNPLAVFCDGAFVGAASVFSDSSSGDTGAMALAQSALSGGGRVATVLLRANVSVSAICNNTGMTAGTVNIDLGNQALFLTGTAPLINAQAKDVSGDGIFNISNGSIVLKKSPLIKSSAYSTDTEGYRGATDTSYKKFVFSFRDVYFTYDKGATASALLASYQDELVSTSANLKVGNTVSFEDCTFNLTNAKSGMTVFNANDTSPSSTNTGKVISEMNVSVSGCEFIFPASIDAFTLRKVNTKISTSVVFDKNSEHSSFRLKRTSQAPEIALPLYGGDTGILISDRTVGDEVVYLLKSDKEAHPTFRPFTDIDLGEEMIFKVYLPKTSALTRVSVGGKTYTDMTKLPAETVSGSSYYVISIPLGAKRMLDDMTVGVTLNESGDTTSLTLKYSLFEYLSQRLEGAGDIERALIYDTLAYAKSAYAYFGRTDSDIAKIDALLGSGYNESHMPATLSDKKPSAAVASAVKLTLNSVPNIRFYTSDKTLKLYIGNKALATQWCKDSRGTYLFMMLSPADMSREITVKRGSQTVGGFGLGSYLAFAKTQSSPTLVTLTERFAKYCQSAAAYLEFAQAPHSHSYTKITHEPTLTSRGYEESICECGYTTVKYTTGLTDKTELNIHLVGNSFTQFNDLYQKLADAFAAGGYVVKTSHTQRGGYKLIQYTYTSSSTEQEYNTKLTNALNNNDFDFVFLQEQSTTPALIPGTFYDGVRAVGKMATDSGAEVILYQTWSRKAPDATLTQENNTHAQFAYRLAAAYEAIAEECGYELSPAGSAFLDVYYNHPSIDLYCKDNYHPSNYGTYLAALCHYATISGKSPIGLSYTLGYDPETSLVLQTAAHNAVFGESIVPASYKTSSKGITASGNSNLLSAIPSGSTLISANITGTKGTVSSTATAAVGSATLTQTQQSDLGDIGYGVSIIGAKTNDRVLSKLIDGVWNSTASNRTSITLTGNHYAADGTLDNNESYSALITLNFGRTVNMTAIGFMSGSLGGFPQEADVLVSNDGRTWAKVDSACYNAGATPLSSMANMPKDKNNATPGVAVLFDMNSASGGVNAQYVRLAIRQGITDSANTYFGGLNTLELAVYGKIN